MKSYSPVLLPKSSSHFWFSGGLSFPRWGYTDILITLEKLSKPRCKALASTTSQEHFIAHKSCSQLIKQCWNEPRSHENINCSSPPSPLIRGCCCFFRDRARISFCSKYDFNTGKDADFVDMGIFCANSFLGFCLFVVSVLSFQNWPWWASCSSAFTLPWNRHFSSHHCNDLHWLQPHFEPSARLELLCKCGQWQSHHCSQPKT